MRMEIADFVAGNLPLLSLLVNIGMLLIWLAYLQLFLSSFMRARRPAILIGRGAGAGIDARCIVGNLSAEPIYVQSIIAEMRGRGGAVAVEVTDHASGAEGKGADPPELGRLTRQGPLASGGHIDVGPFRRMVAEINRTRGQEDREALVSDDDVGATIRVVVVGFMGSDDLLIGAERDYRLERDESGWRLIACTANTRQVRARWRRRAMYRRWRHMLLS